MHNTLSVIDRLTSKLSLVNNLVERVGERLLPATVAKASGYYVDICSDVRCGHYTVMYTCMHVVETGQNINCYANGCVC